MSVSGVSSGRGYVAGLLLLAVALPSLLQGQERLTHERMIETLRLGAVAPAPEGDRVVVQVQHWAYGRSGPRSELWLVDVDQPHAPEVLSLQGANPGDPAWSPDGTRMAYVAGDADGHRQLFVHEMDGEGSRQITRIRTGVRMPRFSPDGTRLTFLSRVFPEAGSPQASAQEMERHAQDPASARIYSGFPYRSYGNQWFDGRVEHLHAVPAHGGPVRDLLAGSRLVAGPGWSGVMEYEWHPEGRAIVFSASEDFHLQADRFDTKDLYLLPVTRSGAHDGASGRAAPDLLSASTSGDQPAPDPEPVLLVDHYTNDRNPIFSPDGRYLAWASIWCCWGSLGVEGEGRGVGGLVGEGGDPFAIHGSAPDVGMVPLPALPGDTMPSYKLNRIMVRDMETGELHVLMEAWDRPPGAPVWSSSGDELFFGAEDEGHDPIYRIRLADALRGDDPVRLVGPPGAWGSPTVAGGRVFAARQSSTRPPELYLLDPARPGEGAARVLSGGGEPPSTTPLDHPIPPGVGGTAARVRRITALNDRILDPVPMTEGEEVFWEHGGRTIQGWLVTPADLDEEGVHPLFLFPHGGPNNMHSDRFHYRWNAQVFAAEGYVVFMPNPAGSTGFGESFAAEIQGEWGGVAWDEIMAGVDYLLATRGYLREERMVAASASYGGYLMNWLITQTDRFQAVFTHASIWNFVSMTGSSVIAHYILADANNRPPWEDFQGFNQYSPHYYAANIRTPTYVSHGGMDAGVPDTQGMELYWTLQRLGVPSRFIHFPDEGHWILQPSNSRVWYRELLDWMALHLED